MKDQEALIDRYLEGLCTEEEKAQINAQKAEDPAFKAYIEKQERLQELAILAVKIGVDQYNAEYGSEKKELLSKKYEFKKLAKKKIIATRMMYLRVAAAACVLVILMIKTFQFFSTSTNTKVPVLQGQLAELTRKNPIQTSIERDGQTNTDQKIARFQELVLAGKYKDAQTAHLSFTPDSSIDRFNHDAACIILQTKYDDQLAVKQAIELLNHIPLSSHISDKVSRLNILAHLSIDDTSKAEQLICTHLKKHPSYLRSNIKALQKEFDLSCPE